MKVLLLAPLIFLSFPAFGQGPTLNQDELYDNIFNLSGWANFVGSVHADEATAKRFPKGQEQVLPVDGLAATTRTHEMPEGANWWDGQTSTFWPHREDNTYNVRIRVDYASVGRAVPTKLNRIALRLRVGDAFDLCNLHQWVRYGSSGTLQFECSLWTGSAVMEHGAQVLITAENQKIKTSRRAMRLSLVGTAGPTEA